MKFNKYIILLLLVCPFLGNAQHYILDRVAKADSLLEEHKDEWLYATESTVEVRFAIGNKAVVKKEKRQNRRQRGKLNTDGPIIGSIETKKMYMNLVDYINVDEKLYYTGMSRFSKLQLYYKKPHKKKPRFGYLPNRFGTYEVAGMFHTDSKYRKFNLAFGLAGQEKGYYAKEDFKDVKYMNNLYFHDNYRAKKKVIKIYVPKWAKVQIKEMNFENFKIEKTKKRNRKGETVYTYTMENVEPWKTEVSAVGGAYTYPHILFAVGKYRAKGKKFKVFQDVADVYNWYNALADSCENNRDSIVSLVERLVEGKKTEKEKIESIYYWVQDNIRYIAFEDGLAGFKPDGANSVKKKKYGDCKGMANLLKEMLTIAGFDARLTWIGTKRLPYDYSFPTLYVDNHMICALNWNDSIYFLDGTEKYQAFGNNAYRIRGKQAMIQDGDKHMIKTVPAGNNNLDYSFSKEKLKLQSDNTLKGTAVLKYRGEEKTAFLNYYYGSNNDKKSKLIKAWYNKNKKSVKVDSSYCMNCTDRTKDIHIKYDVSIKNAITPVDGLLYMDLSFYEPYIGFKKEEDRLSDLEMGMYVNDEKQIEITVPRRAKIQYVPKGFKVENNEFMISASITKKRGKITIKRKVKVYKGIIKLENLKAWEEANKKLELFILDQIIIKK